MTRDGSVDRHQGSANYVFTDGHAGPAVLEAGTADQFPDHVVRLPLPVPPTVRAGSVSGSAFRLLPLLTHPEGLALCGLNPPPVARESHPVYEWAMDLKMNFTRRQFLQQSRRCVAAAGCATSSRPRRPSRSVWREWSFTGAVWKTMTHLISRRPPVRTPTASGDRLGQPVHDAAGDRSGLPAGVQGRADSEGSIVLIILRRRGATWGSRSGQAAPGRPEPPQVGGCGEVLHGHAIRVNAATGRVGTYSNSRTAPRKDCRSCRPTAPHARTELHR